MKRLMLTVAAVVASVAFAAAQNYMVVDSEKIFKSIDAYNQAIKTLDALAEEYQSQVEAKYDEVETLYQTYVGQRQQLSQQTQQAYENQILKKESEAQTLQESLFGNEGTLMKRRTELIKPIQERVFAAIEQYARQNGYDLVLDRASNPTILYYAAKADHTEQIINILK